MACTSLIRPFFTSAGLKWLAEKATLSSFRLSGTRLVQRLINENAPFPGEAAFADAWIVVKVPTHKKFSVM
ncbi:hypothetical protein FEM33_17055 [Dyadobacter flavalbus]|uniref:Uncharacterized protein n=1 Tax=Dyadobacter flavalbus TaxID=2579942 RepID=A0A5M8QQQ0_9BACT|nr:hypothetical protein [Dyadobacter flavalbus]KAA6438399.1 hypothetical protein FEM33_17055 [Dyadobacter flavalbus]